MHRGDEVFLFDRALTAGEIAALAVDPGPLEILADGFESGDVAPLAEFAAQEGAPALAALVVGTDEGGESTGHKSGRRIVEMVWEDLTPDKVVTEAACRNAAVVAMATGLPAWLLSWPIPASRTIGSTTAIFRTTDEIPSRNMPRMM